MRRSSRPASGTDKFSQTRPNWELLTTHSRLAAGRRLLQLGNDNIGDDMAAHSGTVYIRGVPMNWVPAWTNSASENARTDGRASLLRDHILDNAEPAGLKLRQKRFELRVH